VKPVHEDYCKVKQAAYLSTTTHLQTNYNTHLSLGFYHHHHHRCLACTNSVHCIAPLTANNLQSGLSIAGLVASSTLRWW